MSLLFPLTVCVCVCGWLSAGHVHETRALLVDETPGRLCCGGLLVDEVGAIVFLGGIGERLFEYVDADSRVRIQGVSERVLVQVRLVL